MITDLKILVVGCGSIGRRHINNLKSLGMRNFILCDTSKESLELASKGIENPALFTNFKEALAAGPEAAVICTPSSMHLEMAYELAKRGVHILIEKPLSHTIAGCGTLARLVESKGLVAMMAMCYRFHPVFTHLKSLLDSEVLGKVYHVNYYGGHYLPDWHPHADYRKEYASRKDLGGGVVLTSIHGLDTIRWLFGEVAESRTFTDKVSDLEMDVEDLAIGVFRLKSGAYVNWQSDFLQRANQHRMVITGKKGTIRCDFLEGTIDTFLADFGKWYSGRMPFEINTMYVNEMKHFLECIVNRQRPCVDLSEGEKTLRLALDVKSENSPEKENICATA